MQRRYIQGSAPNPAAGADLVDIPNYGDTFRLLSLRAELVTSATVANRFPHFRFVSPSGAVIWESVGSTAQVASSTTVYMLTGANGAPQEGSAVNDGTVGMALPDFWVPAGTKYETVTTALAAGDQWSQIYWSALAGDEWEHLRWLEEIAGAIGG